MPGKHRVIVVFATYSTVHSTVPLIHTSSWGDWRSEAKPRWAREGSAGLNSREGGGRVPGVEVFSLRLACRRNMGRSRLATRVKKYFKTCWSTSGGQESKGSIHQLVTARSISVMHEINNYKSSSFSSLLGFFIPLSKIQSNNQITNQWLHRFYQMVINCQDDINKWVRISTVGSFFNITIEWVAWLWHDGWTVRIRL